MTIVAGDSMLLYISLFVFSLVLLITKSKLLAWKREFVKVRYESAKIGVDGPGWIHRWWYSFWNCSMCCGFWVSLVVCFFVHEHNWLFDTIVVFGINWILHCIEDVLFGAHLVLESAPVMSEKKKTDRSI